MKQHVSRKALALGAAAMVVAAAGAVPTPSSAAVQLLGCTGGTFGDSCGLNELVAGGSIAAGGYLFSNFSLSLNAGRLLDASAIRVDAIDTASERGFSFADIGGTLSVVNGDLKSTNLGFDITPLAGSRLAAGSTMRVAVGQVAGSGSYASVFADFFNSSFTALLGNLTAYCDGATCANSTLSSPATFANPQGALSVVAGIDVAAGPGGTALVNGLSLVISAVPEPASLPLLGLGLTLLIWDHRKRKCVRAQ